MLKNTAKKYAFAETVVQLAKHKTYRYIEDRGEKLVHKLPQFVSTGNCCNSRSIGKPLRDVKNNDFLSVLYKRLLTKYKTHSSKV